MNEREFNAAMGVVLENVGTDVYNVVIDEANGYLETIDDLSVDEAVSLAAATLSDDGIISESAYGLIDSIMEAYENQMVLENLASTLDEDTYEAIVNATGQVMQECDCDISEALDAVLDEASADILDEAPLYNKGAPTEDQKKRFAEKHAHSFDINYARDRKILERGMSGARQSAQPSQSEPVAAAADDSASPNPRPKFSLKGVPGAVGGALANAGRGYISGITGKQKNGEAASMRSKVLARGGTAVAALGATGLAAHHIYKKRKERKEAEARAAAEARKPLNRLKAAITGKGRKAANEAATNAMAYLMECSGASV